VEAELKLKEGHLNSDKGPETSEIAALRAKVDADAKDHQARYDLAMALDAGGDRDGAVEQLLTLVKLDRKWNEEAGRKQLVILFEAMGFSDPRAVEGRKKLSGILFS
jgi:putative thioredoxin